MYDYYPANDVAKRKHQEMIAAAAHNALVRQQRAANRNANPILALIMNLFTR